MIFTFSVLLPLICFQTYNGSHFLMCCSCDARMIPDKYSMCILTTGNIPTEMKGECEYNAFHEKHDCVERCN